MKEERKKEVEEEIEKKTAHKKKKKKKKKKKERRELTDFFLKKGKSPFEGASSRSPVADFQPIALGRGAGREHSKRGKEKERESSPHLSK